MQTEFHEYFDDFFKNEDIKRDVRAIIQPICGIIYNEVYPYLWFLCIYHVFLIFIVLANLILLLRLLRYSPKTTLSNNI